MKKTTWKKHILAVGIALAMCISTAPTAVFAAESYHCFSCNGNYSLGELEKGTYNEAKDCQDKPNQEWLCPICHYVLENTSEGAPGPHQYNSGEVTKDPTCQDEGEKTYTCELCNNTKTESIPKIEHNLEWRQENEATCLDKGNWTEYCTFCKDEFGHREDDMLKADYTGQKWEPDGNGQHKMVCKHCGGKADGHSVTASCEDKDGDQKCDDCGETVSCDHHWGNHEDTSKYVAPTCTEKGRQVYVCDKCGGVVENKELNPLGHVCGEFKWDDNEHWSECAVCGEVIGEKKSHEWKEVSRTEATCTEPGEIKYDCEVPDCNASHDVEIPALGHELEPILAGATCTDEGTTGVKCARPGCDYRDEVPAAAIGHDWKIIEPIEGNEEQHKLICGNDTRHTMLANHNYSGWSEWENNTRSRTCNDCGYQQTVTRTAPETPETPDTPRPRPTTPDETEVPETDVPLIELPEENIPLSGSPEMEITDEEVPMADAPKTVAIEEERPPLADIPKTGDASTALWVMILAASLASFAALARKLVKAK